MSQAQQAEIWGKGNYFCLNKKRAPRSFTKRIKVKLDTQNKNRYMSSERTTTKSKNKLFWGAASSGGECTCPGPELSKGREKIERLLFRTTITCLVFGRPGWACFIVWVCNVQLIFWLKDWAKLAENPEKTGSLSGGNLGPRSGPRSFVYPGVDLGESLSPGSWPREWQHQAFMLPSILRPRCCLQQHGWTSLSTSVAWWTRGSFWRPGPFGIQFLKLSMRGVTPKWQSLKLHTSHAFNEFHALPHHAHVVNRNVEVLCSHGSAFGHDEQSWLSCHAHWEVWPLGVRHGGFRQELGRFLRPTVWGLEGSGNKGMSCSRNLGPWIRRMTPASGLLQGLASGSCLEQLRLSWIGSLAPAASVVCRGGPDAHGVTAGGAMIAGEMSPGASCAWMTLASTAPASQLGRWGGSMRSMAWTVKWEWHPRLCLLLLLPLFPILFQWVLQVMMLRLLRLQCRSSVCWRLQP